MNYTFYDKSGNYYKTYQLDNEFNKGKYGQIYQINDDILLKIFVNYPNNTNFELTFKTIMNMNLENFYQIYQMLYNNNGQFVGYTMKLYKEEEIDILTMPIDYTLDNLKKISNSIKLLTNNNILINDMRCDNSICNNNDIIVIDIDLYQKINKSTYIDIDYKNNSSLLHLFKGLYYRSLCIYHDAINSDNLILDSIFDKDNTVDDICKKLAKYKYPIDYLSERRNRYYGNKIIRYR